MPQEYSNAQIKWICHGQQQVYYEEISNLTAKSTFRLTLVCQLCLFLDDSNIINYGGRIHNVPVSELTRFPYLLPRNHPFTTFAIMSVHTCCTVTAIRQWYWIPAARQYVKKVIRQCVICRSFQVQHTRPQILHHF